jgi:ferredoxin
MAYRIGSRCLKWGLCVSRCPAGAIIASDKVVVDEMTLQPVSIDPGKCTDCGVCVSQEYWCPGSAIAQV